MAFNKQTLIHTSKRPALIAHRGAAGYEIENTVAAFSRALHDGADIIELDVRTTKDGIPVVFHDRNTERLLGIHSVISAESSSFLEALKLGQRSKIPFLEDILEQFAQKIILDIELKDKKSLQPVINLIEKKNLVHRVVLTSFDEEVVYRAKMLCPSLNTGIIIGRKTINPIVRLKEAFPFYDLFRTKANCVVLHYSLAYPFLLKLLHLIGVSVFLWSSMDDEIGPNYNYYHRCLILDVEGIATIWPDKLKNAIMLWEEKNSLSRERKNAL